MLLTLAIIAGMFILERIVVTTTTRSAACQPFYRRCVLVHPNGISILRLPMGIVSCIMVGADMWMAGTLWFAFWMITDMSDGTIARNCDLVTETGQWLDPLSDKVMYFPPLLFLSCGSVLPFGYSFIPFYLVVPFVVLDVLGQVARLWVRKKAANTFGKAKTALVTILLAVIALNQISSLEFGEVRLMNDALISYLMFVCLCLAFLSVYCKLVPDSWYAKTLIAMNALCALTAVAFCIAAYSTRNDRYCYLAFFVIFLGQFFDLFDGRLAQEFGGTGNLALWDEIADGLGYGLAMGTLIFYCLAYRETLVSPMMAAVISMVYVTAVHLNLIRFRNVPLPLPEGRFCGLPLSVGSAMAGSAVLMGLEYDQPFVGYISSGAVIVSILLMVFPLPYQHLGKTSWPALPRAVKLFIALLILLFVIVTMSHKSMRYILLSVCLLLSIIYIFSGLHWSALRRKKTTSLNP